MKKIPKWILWAVPVVFVILLVWYFYKKSQANKMQKGSEPGSWMQPKSNTNSEQSVASEDKAAAGTETSTPLASAASVSIATIGAGMGSDVTQRLQNTLNLAYSQLSDTDVRQKIKSLFPTTGEAAMRSAYDLGKLIPMPLKVDGTFGTKTADAIRAFALMDGTVQKNALGLLSFQKGGIILTEGIGIDYTNPKFKL